MACEVPADIYEREVSESLERLTSEAIKISENPGFDLITSDDGTYDLVFKNGIRLSELLPKEVQLLQSENPVTEASVHWNSKGELTPLAVHLDIEGFKHPDTNKLATFAHEVGHVLSAYEYYKIAHAIPDYDLKDIAQTDQELFDKIQYSLEAASEEVNIEVDAWNYGKIVSKMLGVSDDEYDYLMTQGIRTYQNGNLLLTYNDVTRFIEEYEKELSDAAKSHEFEIYDPSIQGRVSLTLTDLLDLLTHVHDEDEKKRALR